MKYQLEPDNRNSSDEELLKDLKLVASRLGKPAITINDYENLGRFSSSTIKKRFGSWNKALIHSNLKVKRAMNISPDDLLLDLKAVSEELKKGSVTTKEYSHYGKFSVPTISKSFGSWNAALSKAGLKVSSNWSPKISEDDLFRNLATVWETVGRQPKTNDFSSQYSRFSVDTYKRRYGSLRGALEMFIDQV